MKRTALKILIASLSVFAASSAFAFKPDYYACKDFLKKTAATECDDEDGGVYYNAYCGMIEIADSKAGFNLVVFGHESHPLKITPARGTEFASDLKTKLAEAAWSRGYYCVLAPATKGEDEDITESVKASDIQEGLLWEQHSN